MNGVCHRRPTNPPCTAFFPLSRHSSLRVFSSLFSNFQLSFLFMSYLTISCHLSPPSYFPLQSRHPKFGDKEVYLGGFWAVSPAGSRAEPLVRGLGSEEQETKNFSVPVPCWDRRRQKQYLKFFLFYRVFIYISRFACHRCYNVKGEYFCAKEKN